MPNGRILKAGFYSELQSGFRPQGRPKQRYKDNLKTNIQFTGIDLKHAWEDLAGDRSKWRKTCLTGVKHFEVNRIATAKEKRRQRKDPTANPSPTAMPSYTFPCNICG